MSGRRTRLDSLAHVWSLAFVVSALVSCTPSIHDVVARGDVELVTTMIEADASLVHARNDMEKTPLHYAVTNRKDEIITLLIEQGAEVDAADLTGMTPLHVAATLDRYDQAVLLLDNGAEIEARDSFEDTPLHSAAMHGNLKVLNLLAKRGAKLGALNGDGLSPAELAKKYNRSDALKRLETLIADE